MVRPRGSIPISLPCRALTARSSLERQFRNGTRPGHRFHVFLICVYYITIKPVCQPQILPRLATLHTLSSQKVYAREGRRFPRVILSKGGYAVSAAASVGDGRSPLATIAPLHLPTGERSHLPVRSALGKRHRRLTPPPCPLLRGVNFYLAASFADAKLDRASRTAVRLGSCAHPPKGSLVLDLLQKGFPKNNTRLRLPLPARPCRATVSPAGSVGRWATCHRHVAAPIGGGKSRLPLWGSCHGIAVTERGEPGTYSRSQTKNSG